MNVLTLTASHTVLYCMCHWMISAHFYTACPVFLVPIRSSSKQEKYITTSRFYILYIYMTRYEKVEYHTAKYNLAVIVTINLQYFHSYKKTFQQFFIHDPAFRSFHFRIHQPTMRCYHIITTIGISKLLPITKVKISKQLSLISSFLNTKSTIFELKDMVKQQFLIQIYC